MHGQMHLNWAVHVIRIFKFYKESQNGLQRFLLRENHCLVCLAAWFGLSD